MKSASRKTAQRVHARAAAPAPRPRMEWDLCLYVVGESPQSTAAIDNLKQLCEAHLAGNYRVEVIDLLKTPQLSRDHQIVAVPTLVRRLPGPIRKLIGDLSNMERTLVGLQLKPGASKETYQS
jgi:circadian clock protein KaiB